MKVGIDLLYLLPGVVGGTETYAAGLLGGLAQVGPQHEFVVFVSQESASWPLPETPNFIRVVCPVWAISRLRRYLFEQFCLPGLLKKRAVDVVHSLGYVSPLFTPCPSVVTVPDLNYRAFGEQMSISKRLALGFFVRCSALRSERVITISRFSQYEICQAFHLSPDQVIVTLLGSRFASRSAVPADDFTEIQDRLGIKLPYIIAFSNPNPNKNIPRLLQAFAQAKAHHQLRHQLVLVGHQPARKVLPTIFSDEAVRFTGYLDEGTLQSVLANAQLGVFPSFYEGFGLPVLEAMAAGVPVVCSNRASLPEVAGNAALFFDPYSVDDMARRIVKVALDPILQDELREKGFQNLQRFSWENTARKTLDVYESVVKQAI